MEYKTLKKIIELTAYIDEWGEIWGKDTCCYTIMEFESEIEKILKDAGYALLKDSATPLQQGAKWLSHQ